VLQELGPDLPKDIKIRVWDSTAEVRHLVMSQRPPGTENLDEPGLAALVSRDAMVGVAQPRFLWNTGMNSVHDMGGRGGGVWMHTDSNVGSAWPAVPAHELFRVMARRTYQAVDHE
jgi:hypothetical protein